MQGQVDSIVEADPLLSDWFMIMNVTFTFKALGIRWRVDR